MIRRGFDRFAALPIVRVAEFVRCVSSLAARMGLLRSGPRPAEPAFFGYSGI